MSETTNTEEVEAINDAFREKIRDLFGKLVTNLITGRPGEQKAAEQFSVGLGFARRARDLALDAAKSGSTPSSAPDARS